MTDGLCGRGFASPHRSFRLSSLQSCHGFCPTSLFCRGGGDKDVRSLWRRFPQAGQICLSTIWSTFKHEQNFLTTIAKSNLRRRHSERRLCGFSLVRTSRQTRKYRCNRCGIKVEVPALFIVAIKLVISSDFMVALQSSSKG